jgi:hypothetical protein
VTPEAEREYAEIRELIRQSEERQKQFEARSIADFERAMRRMELAGKRAELYEKRHNERWAKADKRWADADKRWETAGQRMDKFDKQILVTKKLVDAGMKMLVRLGARFDSLAKTQQAYMRSLGDGHNGRNGHTGTKRRT